MKVKPVKFEEFKVHFPGETETKNRKYMIVSEGEEEKVYMGIVKNEIDGTVAVKNTNVEISDVDKASVDFDYNLLSAIAEPFKKDILEEQEEVDFKKMKKEIEIEMKKTNRKYNFYRFIEILYFLIVVGASLAIIIYLKK